MGYSAIDHRNDWGLCRRSGMAVLLEPLPEEQELPTAEGTDAVDTLKQHSVLESVTDRPDVIERATIVRILSHLGEATDAPRLAAIRDPPEAARAAFAPEFELQAFDVRAAVMPDYEDERQVVAW